MKRIFAAIIILPALFSSSLAAAQTGPLLQLIQRIALPKVSGRMDHPVVDTATQRLFAVAFENHTLEIVDLKAGQLVHTITGLDEPQQSFYDPSTNHLFVSSSGDGAVKMFDGRSFQLLHTEPLSADADDMRYDVRHKHILVGYGGEKFLYGRATRKQGAGAVAIIDAGSGALVAEIPTDDAHPESFQLETSGTRIFINLPDKQEVEVADLATNTILAHWPVGKCSDNFPMALDEAHDRLFVACRSPSTLNVYDTRNGGTVTSVPLSASLASDDIFYDAAKARVYALGRQAVAGHPEAPSPGLVDVIQQRDADHYAKVATYPTGWAAATGWFVPSVGRLYVASRRDEKGNPGEILVYNAR